MNIIEKGYFLYGGCRRVEVVICRESIRFGSGDEEDPPEVQEDLPGTWWRLWYGGQAGRFFPSLAEAEAEAGRYGTVWERL